METEENEDQFIEIPTETGFNLECKTCHTIVPLHLKKNARKDGCMKCRFSKILNEEVESIHTFNRGEGDKERLSDYVILGMLYCIKVLYLIFLGIWEDGLEPVQAENTIRFVVVSDTHEMESRTGISTNYHYY
jgi:hypothetical protein